MTRPFPAQPLSVLRPLDLARIDAVGFDLDHTLALYDDDAVNALAADATRALLVGRLGYPRWFAAPEALPPMGPAARALSLDLHQGAVVKLDAGRRVRRARHRGRWLDASEVGRRFAGAVPDTGDAAYHVYSPFDLPTLRLFEALTADPRREALPDPVHLCGDIRRMLDATHTDGTLKARIFERLDDVIAPVPGIVGALEAWARAGKRLFVVTNSERDYAEAVLDHVIGSRWRARFDVVATSARKPEFFSRRSGPEPAPTPDDASGARVFDHAAAVDVERSLGVRRERVLFIGDNANADIRPARRFGWRTVHVLHELASDGDAGADGWGSPLEEAGEPTWLWRLVLDHADVVCDRVDRFLATAPDARLAPADDRRKPKAP
jgi:HAD superfamily 5'-nucleotidase-like hydrolase